MGRTVFLVILFLFPILSCQVNRAYKDYLVNNLVEGNYGGGDEFLAPGSNSVVDALHQLEEELAQMNESDPRYDDYELARIIALIRSGMRYPGVHKEEIIEGYRAAANYAERTGKVARVLYELAIRARRNNFRSRFFYFPLVGAAYLEEGPNSLDAKRLVVVMALDSLYEGMIPWELSDEVQEILEEIERDPHRFISIPRHREIGLDGFLSKLFFPPDSYLDFSDEDMDRLRSMDTLSADMLLLGHYSSPYVQNYEVAVGYARRGFAREPNTSHVIYSWALLLALQSFYFTRQYSDMVEYFRQYAPLGRDPGIIPRVNLYAAAVYEITGNTVEAQRLFEQALSEAVFFNRRTYDKEYGFLDSPPANMEILLYEIFFNLRDVFVKNEATAAWAMPMLEAEVERAVEQRAPY